VTTYYALRDDSMGTYTDFFLADFAELRNAFVGWKRPAPERVSVERRNPFTGQAQMMPSWVPDPTDTEPVSPRAGATLGQRLTGLPSVLLKDVDIMKLADLAAVGLGKGATSDEWLLRFGNPPPLVSPEPDERGLLVELPADLVRALGTWSDAERKRVAEQWSEAILESVGDEWSAEDCVAILVDLKGLAAKAEGGTSGKRLYYWA